jgi:S1-C subfamily serine protease
MWFVRAGTRVQGPFTEEQLRSMRKRGQLSPIHQVSLDRVRWDSAASLVQMLDGPLPQWQPQPRPEPAGNAAVNSAGPAPEASGAMPAAGGWYYLDSKRQQFGPVPVDEIVRRIAARQIDAGTMFCKVGDSSWRRMSDVPEFAAYVTRSKKKALWVAAATAAIAVLAGGILMAIRPGETRGRTSAESQEKSSAPVRAERIRSLDEMDMIKNAVGRVELCHRRKYPNGTIIETPIGNGTGFCVTSTGYMLTNRHVVEGVYAERDVDLKTTSGILKARDEMVPVVFFKQIRCPATVVHVSSRFDFAILKVVRSRPCPYFGLSSGDEHRIRTEVVALGFPGVASSASAEEEAMLRARLEADVDGAIQKQGTVYLESRMPEAAFVLSVEDGRVSKLDKESSGWSRITHSAKIFGGNSGGPLVDHTGRVLGINTKLKRDLVQIGKDAFISDGNIYFAYSTGQFRSELDEHIADPLEWLPISN